MRGKVSTLLKVHGQNNSVLLLVCIFDYLLLSSTPIHGEERYSFFGFLRVAVFFMITERYYKDAVPLVTYLLSMRVWL